MHKASKNCRHFIKKVADRRVDLIECNRPCGVNERHALRLHYSQYNSEEAETPGSRLFLTGEKEKYVETAFAICQILSALVYCAGFTDCSAGMCTALRTDPGDEKYRRPGHTDR